MQKKKIYFSFFFLGKDDLQIEKRNLHRAGLVDPGGVRILVGPDCAHSTGVRVEDVADYPLEPGVTYAMCTWQDSAYVTEYMSLA